MNKEINKKNYIAISYRLATGHKLKEKKDEMFFQ